MKYTTTKFGHSSTTFIKQIFLLEQLHFGPSSAWCPGIVKRKYPVCDATANIFPQRIELCRRSPAEP